jgi:glyoxylase-like metal-dependent hydrolase (beta-lactamase superfamily II)
MDSDHVSYDARASTGLRFNEIAPGVQHVVGGTHNSMIVEMSDYLIAFDAPVTDWQSVWTIAEAKKKYPNKPIRYIVLTHHHMDHNGGVRGYVAEGATLVVGQGAADHYRKMFAAPYTRNPDLQARSLASVQIIEVSGKHVFNDGKREVSAHILENPHSSAYLMGYVADARIAYVTDVYTPGPPLPAKINPALASVVNGVRNAGIQPLTIAGGHGATAPYALLFALAAN